MRNKFDAQLLELNDKLIQMGALIESAIANAVSALNEQEVETANKAIDFDEEIDQAEKEIEALCLKLLLQQQPVAKDLRLISSALKMITDMERIGDQAADIAEITIQLAKLKHIKIPKHIRAMAQTTIQMVNDSIDAFVKKDLNLAYSVIKCDDTVDNLFDMVKDSLIKRLVEDTNDGAQVIDLIMIAKYFERIGDHATNIAEWVVFSITGTHKKYKSN